MKNSIYTISTLLLFSFFTSCEDSNDNVTDPGDPHEEELITSVKLEFSDNLNVLSDTSFQFVDIDGVGGNDPTVFDTIVLKKGTTYNVAIKFLNESESPAEDITEEILEESDEHIVCYTPDGSQLQVTRTDSDGTYEIGLSSSWVTTNTENGTVTVALKHQPDGAKNGNCAPGETDVEVAFAYKIID